MIRKLLPILGITFIDIVGFSMIIPMLPYFVTHFGALPWVVGILASVFSICQLISGPIWGNVSDRIGRKAVLIISQIGATVGWVMLAFAPNMFWVFIARMLEGASGGNIGITQAYVADLVEAKDRSRAFGFIGATFGLGMVFGPAGASLIQGRFGFSAVFLAAAALQVLTLLITIVALPEKRDKHDTSEEVGFRDIIDTLRKPHLRPVLLQKLALSMTLYGWYLVIALYLQQQLGIQPAVAGYFFSIFAILGVFNNIVMIGQVSKRVGDYRMANIAIGALIVMFAIVPFVHSIWTLLATVVLFSFGQALANSGITAQISNASNDNEQGTVLGVSSALDSVAGIAAPPISTGMLTRFGSPFAGVESLVCAVIALAIGVAFPGRSEGDHANILAPVPALDVPVED